jgi:hypothetical protein
MNQSIKDIQASLEVIGNGLQPDHYINRAVKAIRELTTTVSELQIIGDILALAASDVIVVYGEEESVLYRVKKAVEVWEDLREGQ